MERAIKKLDEILNGKAKIFLRECIEKEIKEIKEKEFLFDDLMFMHNKKRFLAFKLKLEKELRNKGYKENSEVIEIFENFCDTEMNFDNYTKLLWKEVRNSNKFLKYKIKDKTILVIKKAGRNGHKFAKEKFEEYEFPF